MMDGGLSSKTHFPLKKARLLKNSLFILLVYRRKPTCDVLDLIFDKMRELPVL